MAHKPTSSAQQVWSWWRSLRLPWRSRFLAGVDLEGNTYWEFHDALSSHKHRMRRIVQYRQATHLSDVQTSPNWHSWLRHVRDDPPTLAEQSQDLLRRQQLKVLAAQADARWAAKRSFLERPRSENSEVIPDSTINHTQHCDDTLMMNSGNGGVPGDGQRPADMAEEERMFQGIKTTMAESTATTQGLEKPPSSEIVNIWKQANSVPNKEWQPKRWVGPIGRSR